MTIISASNTMLESLCESLGIASKHSAGEAPPVAILWTDAKGEWLSGPAVVREELFKRLEAILAGEPSYASLFAGSRSTNSQSALNPTSMTASPEATNLPANAGTTCHYTNEFNLSRRR